MRYLLDTSIFLWWLNDDKKLKDFIKELILDSSNVVYVSVISALEMSIKHKKGKLPLKTTLERCFKVSPFQVLDIRLEHILNLNKLPSIHNDPFDRLLIAQSQVEKLTLITVDKKIQKYKLRILGA